MVVCPMPYIQITIFTTSRYTIYPKMRHRLSAKKIKNYAKLPIELIVLGFHLVLSQTIDNRIKGQRVHFPVNRETSQYVSDEFLGIPYAEKPGRFQRAELKQWEDLVAGDYTSYGNLCPQNFEPIALGGKSLINRDIASDVRLKAFTQENFKQLTLDIEKEVLELFEGKFVPFGRDTTDIRSESVGLPFYQGGGGLRFSYTENGFSSLANGFYNESFNDNMQFDKFYQIDENSDVIINTAIQNPTTGLTTQMSIFSGLARLENYHSNVVFKQTSNYDFSKDADCDCIQNVRYSTSSTSFEKTVGNIKITAHQVAVFGPENSEQTSGSQTRNFYDFYFLISDKNWNSEFIGFDVVSLQFNDTEYTVEIKISEARNVVVGMLHMIHSNNDFVLPNSENQNSTNEIRENVIDILLNHYYKVDRDEWPEQEWMSPDRIKMTKSRAIGPAFNLNFEDLSPSIDEDCLTLNLWSPKVLSQTLLPVVVYVPDMDRNLKYMSSGSLYTNGRRWAAEHNTIFINFNYRVGVFGYCKCGGETNIGLHDQLLALDWVKKNILKFRGDPNRVSVMGKGSVIGNLINHEIISSSIFLDDSVCNSKIQTETEANKFAAAQIRDYDTFSNRNHSNWLETTLRSEINIQSWENTIFSESGTIGVVDEIVISDNKIIQTGNGLIYTQIKPTIQIGDSYETENYSRFLINSLDFSTNDNAWQSCGHFFSHLASNLISTRFVTRVESCTPHNST